MYAIGDRVIRVNGSSADTGEIIALPKDGYVRVKWLRPGREPGTEYVMSTSTLKTDGVVRDDEAGRALAKELVRRKFERLCRKANWWPK